METVLFTDNDVVVFVIITSALALTLSVLGLTTTSQTRSEIQHQFCGSSTDTAISKVRSSDEWNLVKEQFHALVRDRSDNVEDIFDAQFRTRFSELIYQAAGFDKSATECGGTNYRKRPRLYSIGT